MQVLKKWYGIFMLAVVLVMFAGCQKDLSEEATNQVEVFTVGDETVYLNEVYIYARTIQQEYEQNYGAGIWAVELQNENGEVQTVETITKEDIIEEILQVKVLNDQADSFGVALTPEETAEIEQQAQEFMDGLTDADIQETGVTYELAVQVYQENAVADKVYERIMESGSVEVSDEQCRQTKVYDLYFPTYLEQADGEFVTLSDEEKETQYNTAMEAYGRITDPEEALSIENAAYEYGSTNSSFYTMSYSEYVEQYGQELADQIYSMKDGEYLGVVESEYGYHIFQMISLTDAEATQEKKAEMEEELQRTYFNEVFDSYLNEMDSSWKFSKNVNEDAWNLIQFSSQTDSTEE